ncbi:MAG: VOC family protein [Gammaproteobacteria bacterium]|nr:VOC family protein [Gammaproteobacteria bacterium]
MEILSLDHLVLTVKDINISVDFYCRLLGMKHIQFGDNRHALSFGDQKINLHQADNIFLPAAKRPAEGSADLCFIVGTPIEQIVAELNEADVDIIQGPVERTGATGKILSVYIRDPDMNLLELSNRVNIST